MYKIEMILDKIVPEFFHGKCGLAHSLYKFVMRESMPYGFNVLSVKDVVHELPAVKK